MQKMDYYNFVIQYVIQKLVIVPNVISTTEHQRYLRNNYLFVMNTKQSFLLEFHCVEVLRLTTFKH